MPILFAYAIYLAQSTPIWPHNQDLVVAQEMKHPTPAGEEKQIVEPKTTESNIAILRKHGISKLFHFTDESNLPSIRVHGLMSATSLTDQSALNDELR